MAVYTGTEGNDSWLGTAGADQANGLGGTDFLRGLGGDDEIDGGAGNDLIECGADNDILRGGDDDDRVLGGTGNDLIEGGAGADTLRGDAGNDDLSGGDGSDFFRGGSGVDHFDGGAHDETIPSFGGYGDRISFFEQDATQGVIADLRTGIISNDGFGNVETMTGIESLGAGTVFADTFYGNDFRNFLFASPGDSVYGFGGDDQVLVQGAIAALDGGDGIDELGVTSSGGYFLPDDNGDGIPEMAPEMSAGWTVNLATGTLIDGKGDNGSFVGFENILGSHLADVLTGDGGVNQIDGSYGDDLIDGGGGADRMTGGWGADTFILDNALDEVIEQAGGGIDEIRAGFLLYTLPDGVENFLGTYAGTGPAQTVFGNGLANRLTGSSADDMLVGEDGKDVLVGGEGIDILTGGSGYDVLIGGTLSATNLIVNGGFETQDGTNVTRNYIRDDNTTRDEIMYRETSTLFGWESVTGDPFEVGTYFVQPEFSSADGDSFLEMEAAPGENLTITQDISGLAAGTTLLLTFSFALATDAPPPQQEAVSLIVFWNDEPVGGVVPVSTEMAQFSVLVRARAVGTGTGGANRLTFSEVGDPDGIGTLLDGVSLRVVNDDGGINWVSYDSEIDGGSRGVVVNLGTAAIGAPNGITVYGGTALDTHGGIDQLRGINAVRVAGEADSIVIGSADANHFEGGDGDDYFDGGAGADVMAGNLGDDVYVVDILGDTVTENANAGTDEIRTGLGVGANQPLRIANQYQLAANVENLTGTGSGQGLRGNSLDNVIAAGAGADFVNLSDGGADTVSSGDGRDVVYFGGAMTSADATDAGSAGGDPRGDLLILQGDYSAGLTFGAGAIVGIEKLRTLKGVQSDFGDTAGNLYSYDITTVDANVAAGARLVVQGGSLQIGEHLTFDGSAEMDGGFQIFGGHDSDTIEGGAQADHLLGRNGDDHLIGHGGNDRFRGGLGQDLLEGGAGADIFVYAAQGGAEGYANAALESSSVNYDTIDGFSWGEDKIDLPTTVTGISTDGTGALSQASFDADLASALGSFAANSAVLFTPDSGDLAGRHFLVVDANGSGGYQADLDFVIELTSPSSLLPPVDPSGVFI